MSLPHSLPGPNADFWDWQLHSACRGEASEIFYHPDGERGRARTQRENRAKAICFSCPVLTQCREHALRVAEPYGIWGGMSESERSAVLRGAAGGMKVAAASAK
ncbi:WhiB family transcriptional regulator [Corynebacterium jeddahense]|uniref:Transcriptional regulator WhiB n=1 Tax=Corynebacterium jeddahense TaxID=1414719 RepID=A0ABY7UHJ3_9CORY|nr:WhiB family transcriptional regulator [Corynebacterium jeddahense]WCZ38091.1 Redox-responsive transcriptional regulator WhiB3 [Corynebacterium jeddahense]